MVHCREAEAEILRLRLFLAALLQLRAPRLVAVPQQAAEAGSAGLLCRMLCACAVCHHRCHYTHSLQVTPSERPCDRVGQSVDTINRLPPAFVLHSHVHSLDSHDKSYTAPWARHKVSHDYVQGMKWNIDQQPCIGNMFAESQRRMHSKSVRSFENLIRRSMQAYFKCALVSSDLRELAPGDALGQSPQSDRDPVSTHYSPPLILLAHHRSYAMLPIIPARICKSLLQDQVSSVRTNIAPDHTNMA